MGFNYCCCIVFASNLFCKESWPLQLCFSPSCFFSLSLSFSLPLCLSLSLPLSLLPLPLPLSLPLPLPLPLPLRLPLSLSLSLSLTFFCGQWSNLSAHKLPAKKLFLFKRNSQETETARFLESKQASPPANLNTCHRSSWTQQTCAEPVHSATVLWGMQAECS